MTRVYVIKTGFTLKGATCLGLPLSLCSGKVSAKASRAWPTTTASCNLCTSSSHRSFTLVIASIFVGGVFGLGAVLAPERGACDAISFDGLWLERLPVDREHAILAAALRSAQRSHPGVRRAWYEFCDLVYMGRYDPPQCPRFHSSRFPGASSYRVLHW